MFGVKVRMKTGGLIVEYDAGDVIWYRPFGGGLRRVIVEERLADVKNGRPGFDGLVLSGPEKGVAVWGYDDQIVPLRSVRNDGERTRQPSTGPVPRSSPRSSRREYIPGLTQPPGATVPSAGLDS
jgi:hypothetical protein